MKRVAHKTAASLTLLAFGFALYMAGDAVKVWHRHRTKIANSPFRTVALQGASQRFLGDLDSETGTASSVWREFMPADSILGWRMGPNVAVSQYGKYLYATNKQGFLSIGENDFYYPPRKRPGALRVVVLGGSTVMGCGSPTPASNLPAMIQKSLLGMHPPPHFQKEFGSHQCRRGGICLDAGISISGLRTHLL